MLDTAELHESNSFANVEADKGELEENELLYNTNDC